MVGHNFVRALLAALLFGSLVVAGCHQSTAQAEPPPAGEQIEPEATTQAMVFEPIGVIRSPYSESAPYQPLKEADGEFRLELDDRYAPALKDLDSFRYIYVLYYLDRQDREPAMVSTPPWAPEGTEVGLFAARSPLRPNPIGLSVVEVRKIDGSTIHTSGLDAFDGTPVLDIKPYIAGLDTRDDANAGWIDGLPDAETVKACLSGVVPEGMDPAPAKIESCP